MKRRGRKGCAREKGDEKKLRKEIEINVRATNLEVAACLDLQIVAGIQSINLSVDAWIGRLMTGFLDSDKRERYKCRSRSLLRFTDCC